MSANNGVVQIAIVNTEVKAINSEEVPLRSDDS